MSTHVSLHKSFEAGLLYMQAHDNSRLLLQVCTDFDVAKRELDTLFGKSTKLLNVFEEPTDPALERSRAWSIMSEKQLNLAFSKFFRPFKKPEEVVRKPGIAKLVLMPYTMDQPIIPNDLCDRQHAGE